MHRKNIGYQFIGYRNFLERSGSSTKDLDFTLLDKNALTLDVICMQAHALYET